MISRKINFISSFLLVYSVVFVPCITRERAGKNETLIVPIEMRAKNHRYDDEDVYYTNTTSFDMELQSMTGEESTNNRTEFFEKKDIIQDRQDLPEINDIDVEFQDEITNLQNPFPIFPQNSRRQQRCGSCRCGSQPSQRSTRGQIVNQFPWIALLSYFDRFYCSASLINNLYLLSAGHCTRGYLTVNIKAKFFNYERDISGEQPDLIRRISRVFRPTGFDVETLNNDISLLRLVRPITLQNRIIRPICLPIPQSSFRGRQGIVTRWLTTRIGVEESTSMLRAGVVPIIDNRRCRNTDLGDVITDRMLCALNSRRDETGPCSGDNGGPLMVVQSRRYRIAGIVSWSGGCGRVNIPGVYTRVTKFINWIQRLSVGACWCR